LKYAQRGFAIAIPGLARPLLGSLYYHPCPSVSNHAHTIGCICGLLRYDHLRLRHSPNLRRRHWYQKSFGVPTSLSKANVRFGIFEFPTDHSDLIQSYCDHFGMAGDVT
jgi:hypothetical protein